MHDPSTCETCVMTARIREVEAEHAPAPAVMRLVDDLFMAWVTAETDASIYKAKLDGTWPTGDDDA